MVVRNQNQQQQREPSVAEDVVSESLGLDLNNLEGDNDDGEGDDGEGEGGGVNFERGGNDEGEHGEEGEGEGRQPENQLQDLTRRVSHTDKNRLSPRAEVKPDKKGNLVDASGKVVARAGAEARFYQNAHKATRELAQIRQQSEGRINDLSTRLNKAVEIGTQIATELEQFRERDKQIKSLNLTPELQMEALQLAAESVRDPLSAIRKLLTRAAARGINLQELGLTGNADPKSLMDMVREEINKGMNPLRERQQVEARQRQQEEQHARTKEQITADVNTFFQNEPNAKYFMPVFESIMGNPQNAGMPLREVWKDIQLNLLQRGETVDSFIKNLRQRGNNERGAPQRRSLPRGRGQPVNTEPNGRGDEMAPISSSYDDILKGVLSSTGYGRTDV